MLAFQFSRTPGAADVDVKPVKLPNRFSVSCFLRHKVAFCNTRVFLAKHKVHGMWLPIGGRLAEGESPLECVARKITSEAGVPFLMPKMLGHGIPDGMIGYNEHVAGDSIHMNFVFVADAATDRITLCDQFVGGQWVEETDSLWDQTPANVRQYHGLAYTVGL